MVNRGSDDKVRYKLIMPMMTMEGFVEHAKKAALTDGSKLDQWKDANPRACSTLAQARAVRDRGSHVPCPGGAIRFQPNQSQTPNARESGANRSFKRTHTGGADLWVSWVSAPPLVRAV